MTQPPDDPTPDGDAPEGWQPPGPAPGPPPPGSLPAPGQIPSEQNPYGGGTVSYYQPSGGGMSTTVKVILGVLIGFFGGFFLWFVALLGFADSTGNDVDVFFFAAVAPLMVPAPLLIWRATRPWAAGLLIGTAVTSIGLSSFCSALLGPGGV